MNFVLFAILLWKRWICRWALHCSVIITVLFFIIPDTLTVNIPYSFSIFFIGIILLPPKVDNRTKATDLHNETVRLQPIFNWLLRFLSLPMQLGVNIFDSSIFCCLPKPSLHYTKFCQLLVNPFSEQFTYFVHYATLKKWFTTRKTRISSGKIAIYVVETVWKLRWRNWKPLTVLIHSSVKEQHSKRREKSRRNKINVPCVFFPFK